MKICKKMSAVILALVLSLSLCIPAFASDTSVSANQNIISHSEEWIAQNKRVEVTVYDLGNVFTATETITDEYVSGVQRASGTKTQTSTVEIKNKSVVAATITVSGTFSYDGSKAEVVKSSYSRTISSGYTEDQWATGERDSSLLMGDALVNAILIIKHDETGRTYTGTAQVTCSKNG